MVAEASGLKLSQINGRILGGEFSLQNYGRTSESNNLILVLQDIDLEEGCALQNNQAFVFRVKIYGRIPVLPAATNVEVDDVEWWVKVVEKIDNIT